MSLSRVNSSAATLTKNRTEGSVVPASGMCVTCVDGCIGMCEIGKSAYRGHEVIYPQPFGVITTAGEKAYPVDYSHFNIMGTAAGAQGIEADSDKAIFPAVNLEVVFGHEHKLKFRYPWIIPGLGSTNIAKNNWEGLAIGSALAGTGLTIGENVAGMDPDAVIKNGRVVNTADLKRRVQLYKAYQRNGYGAIVVQANIEDTRLAVQEYAIAKLGVECVELKWGQGAKDIGGEVKINSLSKAQMLHERGYIVLPDPTDPTSSGRLSMAHLRSSSAIRVSAWSRKSRSHGAWRSCGPPAPSTFSSRPAHTVPPTWPVPFPLSQSTSWTFSRSMAQAADGHEPLANDE